MENSFESETKKFVEKIKKNSFISEVDSCIEKDFPSFCCDCSRYIPNDRKINVIKNDDDISIEFSGMKIHIKEIKSYVDDFLNISKTPIVSGAISFMHGFQPYLSKSIFSDYQIATRCLSKVYAVLRHVLNENFLNVQDKEVESVLCEEIEFFESVYTVFMKLAKATKADEIVYVIGNVRKGIRSKQPPKERRRHKTYKENRTFEEYLNHRQFDLKFTEIRYFWCDKEIAQACYDVAIDVFKGIRIASQELEMVSRIGEGDYNISPGKETNACKLFKIIYLNKLYKNSSLFCSRDIMSKLPDDTDITEKLVSRNLLNIFQGDVVYKGVLERVERDVDRVKNDLEMYNYRVKMETGSFLLLSSSDVGKYSNSVKSPKK